MKKVLAILGGLIILFILGIWFFYFRGKKTVDKGPKTAPLAVSKHSDAFNRNMDSVLNTYYSMVEGFVNWDTATINKQALEFKSALENFRIDELQKDTSEAGQLIHLTTVDFLANVKNDVNTLLNEPSIEKKREVLNLMSRDNLRNLLVTIKYDREKIYYQECPMAFNDEDPGYWLSQTNAVRNPYLGTKHPKYKSGMLECGGPKDTINFIPK
ncbi:MAG: DUF3347 domain-containing protein [Chitinophagaceae bacterium]|nr:DUF3347 domain-containing protein [Chitinophagaceae bacterium]